MNIKKLKPTSPGQRHQILIKKNILCKNGNILKNKICGLKNTSGHSTQTGHITVWHKGTGCKKKYRVLSLPEKKLCIFIFVAILYDPNRNAFIALRFNIIKCLFDFILYTKHIAIGTLLEYKIKDNDFIKIGCFSEIKYVPIGTLIHSIQKKNKIIFTKSAGTFSQLIQKTHDKVKIKLPSGKILITNSNFNCIIGSVANENFNLQVIGKAGKTRYLNRRPIVRGVAMNPVDHPHGGRTKGGRPSVSPWGKLTKGVPTVKKKYV